MLDADRLTLVDVLVNRKLSNTNSMTHSDMSAFYLSERKGHKNEQAPDREYYFYRRYHAENPGEATEVIAPGFNSEWDCLGTLVPNDPDSFTLDQFRFNSCGSRAYFVRPPFGIAYDGLSKACKHLLDIYPLSTRRCFFIDHSGLYCIGEDTSKFVRRLFSEEPDQDDEEGMRRMFNHLIMDQLLYVLDVSLMPESAPWFRSRFDT